MCGQRGVGLGDGDFVLTATCKAYDAGSSQVIACEVRGCHNVRYWSSRRRQRTISAASSCRYDNIDILPARLLRYLPVNTTYHYRGDLLETATTQCELCTMSTAAPADDLRQYGHQRDTVDNTRHMYVGQSG